MKLASPNQRNGLIPRSAAAIKQRRPKPEPRTPVLGRKSALDAIIGRLCDGAHSLTIIRHARPAAVVRPDGVGRGDLLDREPAENLARQRR